MRPRSGIQIDRRSLVETASELVDISSPTGEEQAMAEYLARAFAEMGLQSSGSRSRTAAPTCSAPGAARAAGRR